VRSKRRNESLNNRPFSQRLTDVRTVDYLCHRCEVSEVDLSLQSPFLQRLTDVCTVDYLCVCVKQTLHKIDKPQTLNELVRGNKQVPKIGKPQTQCTKGEAIISQTKVGRLRVFCELLNLYRKLLKQE